MTNQKEVEIRYQLRDEAEIVQVRNALSKLHWVPCDPVRQEDFYFCNAALKDAGKTKESPFVLRVRSGGDEARLTYKSFNGATDGSWIEIESSISNPDAMKSILAAIGLAEYVRIIKTRESGHIQDVELNLDHIEGLGSFVEMEVMTNDVEKGRRHLRSIAASLGIPDSQVVTVGYVQLVEDKM
ncbi:MAG: class IV adenylate cyclase [Candidatus Nomurabacteria bacterium]|nr:MAG: class IV adenylate cyclase [Candidatus Nomurabacteria bacterium]